MKTGKDTTDIYIKLREFCFASRIIEPGDAVLVGISGGSDSVALLDMMKRLTSDIEGLVIQAAHFNHRLRENSGNEAEIVRKICHKAGVELTIGIADNQDKAMNKLEGIHSDARYKRYAFLNQTASKWQNDLPKDKKVKIAVGHQEDDQIETILMRLFSGSGIMGVGGIRPVGRCPVVEGMPLIRPLLNFTRCELMDYCRKRKLDYVQDFSNDDPRYPRSRIRNKVLPLIDDLFGASGRKGIVRSGSLLRLAGEELRKIIQDAYVKSLADFLPGDLSLDYFQFISYNNLIRLGMLQIAARAVWDSIGYSGTPRISFERCQIADDYIQSGGEGTVCLGEGLVLQNSNGRLYIFATGQEIYNSNLFIGTDLEIHHIGIIRTDVCDASEVVLPPTDGVLYLDVDEVEKEILLVRPAKYGDKMLPLGAGNYLSVTDLLRDAGIPPHRRTKQPVIFVSGEIAALLPHRIGERFKLKPNFQRALRLRLIPAALKQTFPY